MLLLGSFWLMVTHGLVVAAVHAGVTLDAVSRLGLGLVAKLVDFLPFV